MAQDWISETVSTLAPICTAAEAAAVLRTTTRNLRRMVARGRINAVRACDGGSSRVLIPRAEIGRYLRSLAVSP
jgi:excisionase family DNA binding protein